MNYELIAFDMDGTLLSEESCWRMIHKNLGTQEKAKENLEAWEKGEIDYPEFMRRDIKLWKPTPHISQIEEILSRYNLPSKVPRTFEKIWEKGYETAIITGGLDILAKQVANELDISHVFANGLETDDKGYLTGEGIFRVDPRKKSKNLKNLLEKLDINQKQCISVGNSAHDLDLLSSSGMGIAINDEDSLSDSADVVIQGFENFDQILNYL